MREGIRLPTGSGILRARNNLEIRSYVVAIVSDNQRLHKFVRLTCHAKQHDERTHTLYFFDWRIESKEPIDPYPILRYKNYHPRWDHHRAVVSALSSIYSRTVQKQDITFFSDAHIT